jgi:hypothetical protein
MGGTLAKLLVGVFFVGLSSQLGELAQDVVSKARESVQASELMTLDGTLAAWAMEQRRTRAPEHQEEFERTLEQILTARGPRRVTHDRWDRPYAYEHFGDSPLHWRISSGGPDRLLGNGDDLVVERIDDRVEMTRDPVEIAEMAIDRALRLDRETVGELRAAAAKLDPEERAPPQGPLLDAKAEETAQHAQSLAQLDELLR